jgi:hypothetical protein
MDDTRIVRSMIAQHNYGPRRTDTVSSSIKWNGFFQYIGRAKHANGQTIQHQTINCSKLTLQTIRRHHVQASHQVHNLLSNDLSVTIPEYEGSHFRSRTDRTQEMITRTLVHEQTALKKCSDSPKTRPPAPRTATKVAANEAPASCRGKSPPDPHSSPDASPTP